MNKTMNQPRTFEPELLDRLLEGVDPLTIMKPGGLIADLKRALAERALKAEMSQHLGTDEERETGNTRNGHGRKTVRTGDGSLDLLIPRDRKGTFEPRLIGKHQRRFAGFDEIVMELYGGGMSTRDVGEHMRTLYGVEVSPSLVSAVTEAVADEVREWRSRPLEACYPIVFLDALRVKVRHDGSVVNKAVHLAIGVGVDGHREILGMWIGINEGAKFWMGILDELRQRGVEDILIAVVDGLRGFPEAIEAVFPETVVQSCIVHLLRNSLAYVPWKERRAVAQALKAVYRAANPQTAAAALDAFANGPHGQKYPMIARAWRRQWEAVVPFLDFPQEVRHMIYTTNAIESLNSKVRKAVRNRGHFPDDDAACKAIYLALRRATKKWGHPPPNWHAVKLQLAVRFGDRFRVAQ